MDDQTAPKKTSITFLLGLAVVLALVVGLLLSLSHIARTQRMYTISTFAECKEAGYPILESYPEQCATPDGRMFANDAVRTQIAPVMNNGTSTPFNEATTVPQAI